MLHASLEIERHFLSLIIMKILIACEYSGIVREAFKLKGHDVTSCDLLPTEIEGSHYQGDLFDIIEEEWDMIIAFPPCTDLSVSGARHFKEKIADGRQQKSIEFFLRIANNKCPRIAIENPIGIMSTKFRKPDQIIQPWMFGHGETKATCLWLKGLPLLTPTNVVEGREQRIWKMPPSKDRAKLRSKTYQGIADAMAEKWSNL
jgi:site-specific DNA-cytosine methylase